MHPQTSTQFETKTNFAPLQSFDMKISVKAMPHIMHLLTKLYSDEALAVIREYSTNANDSHVVAGTTRPIEVSLPTVLDPVFRVKDYGVGMDVQDIGEVYCEYGESTKHSDARQNGFMGIGAKSALAFTNQFTVVGIKNGVRTVVIVSRKSSGVGSMDIASVEETNESPGVEIIIPVADVEGFSEKAKFFFSFWDEDAVLIDGEKPTNDFRAVKDNIFWSKELDEDYFVMSGVAYPIERIIGKTTGIVIYVDPHSEDEVTITPNREALIYDDRTEAVINKYRAEISDEWPDFVRRLGRGKAPDEYLDLVFSAHVGSVEFNGEVIDLSDNLKKGYDHVGLISNVYSYQQNIRVTGLGPWDKISLDVVRRTENIFIHSTGKSQYTRPEKDAMIEQTKKILGNFDWTTRIYISEGLYHDAVHHFGGKRVIDWADIKDQVRKPAKAAPRSVKAAEYDIWTKGPSGHAVIQYGVPIPTGSKVIYVTKRAYSGHIPSGIKALVQYSPRNYVYVVAYASQVPGLLKDFPDATGGARKAQYDELLADHGITAEDFHYQDFASSGPYHWLLNNDRVKNDPELMDFVMGDIDAPAPRVYTSEQEQVIALTRHGFAPQLDKKVVTVSDFTESISERFPLLDRWKEDASIDYIEMIKERG